MRIKGKIFPLLCLLVFSISAEMSDNSCTELSTELKQNMTKLLLLGTGHVLSNLVFAVSAIELTTSYDCPSDYNGTCGLVAKEKKMYTGLGIVGIIGMCGTGYFGLMKYFERHEIKRKYDIHCTNKSVAISMCF